MNRRIWTVVSFLGLIAVGCNGSIEIKDGEVPQELIPQVTPYVGTYAAKRFRQGGEELDAQLRVELQGKRLVAEIDTDLAGDGCGSKIGELKSLSAADAQTSGSGAVEADFAFDSGRCTEIQIDGLNLKRDADGTMTLNYYHANMASHHGKVPKAITWTLTRQN